MTTSWRLYPETAIGQDTRGDWHTASDFTRCKCGSDHRADVEAEFAIKFEDRALESWAALESEYAAAQARGSSPTISADTWQSLRAGYVSTMSMYAKAAAKAARTDSLWPVNSEQVKARFWAMTALRTASAELGIREPMITFHENAGDGSRLYGQASLSEHSISIRADLDPDMMTRAVRHECKHLALYQAGANHTDEEACHQFADQAARW